MVATFPDIFAEALRQDINLPQAIQNALEDTSLAKQVTATGDLVTLIESIPAILQTELQVGDQGVLVTLLQLYLMYGSEGLARDQLAAAGPTGYYGRITAAAVGALQTELEIEASGTYNAKTQQTFAGRTLSEINLGN